MDKIFSLAEANQLIPQLEDYLTAVRRGKAVLLRTKPEIKKAASKAQLGGGSCAGPHYIRALQEITHQLNEIQELGVQVKDLDMGLCDFPHLMDGRVVYLCWRFGESEIQWWHEVDSGYSGRQRLETENC